MQLFINYWSTSLTVAATAEAVSLSVSPAEAANLVGLGAGDHYLLTLFEVDSLTGEELRREIVRATAVSGGNITVVRDQEGTGAQVWDAGQLIEARLTKETMEALRDAAGGGAPLSNDDPAALGSVNPGESSEASRSDHAHPLPTPADIGAATAAQGAAADSAIPLTQKGAASGVATLDSGSKIPLAQLPATAITSTSVVASEAAMLALSAQEGDVAIRTDIETSFILATEPASTLANWQELLSPAAGGGAPVGSATPQPLGTATPGVSTSASRQDHVHTMPTASDVGADVAGAASAAQAHAVQRGNHTGTQTASTISDFAATVRATVLTGLSLADTTVVTATDTVLQAIGKLAGRLATAFSRANHTGTQLASTISDFDSASRAQTEAELVAGTNVTITPAGSGATRTLTIAATGGGGGVSLPVAQALSSTRNLGLADINTFNVNSTTNNYTATIPPQSSVTWTADAEIHFLPDNTGDITITAGAGVSLNGVVAGSITLSTQYGAASIKRIAADSWWVGGVIGTLADYTNLTLASPYIWDSAGDSASYHPPSYAKVGDVVRLRGKVTLSGTHTDSSTVNVTTIATLPVGFRPAKRKAFQVFWDTDSPLHFAYCLVFVNTDGTIVLLTPSPTQPYPFTEGHLPLDQIWFDLAL